MSIKDEVLKALNYLRLSSNPVGTIIWYIGSDVPEGYLLCNGAEISRTDYARLFAVLGVKCGAGDGTNTFNLPDFDGRVPQATSDPSKVGQKLESQLPNISGYFSNILYQKFVNGVAIDARGAFSNINVGGEANTSPTAEKLSGFDGVGFEAKNSNIIYSGSKVQVDAIQALACIRC